MGTADNNTDNNYHVVVMQTLQNGLQIQLESVKIVEGFADGALFGGSLTNDSSGGGILINSAFVLLTDVIVMDCFGRFGGGIAALHDTLVSASTRLEMKWSTVRDNLAEVGGGGIYIDQHVGGHIANSVIRGNGGPTDGGGIMLAEDVTDFVITSTSVFDNKCRNRGGGIFTDGPSSGTTSAIVFVNLTVTHNDAASGVGVYYASPNGGTAVRECDNTILFDNPSGLLGNDDNFVLMPSNTFQGYNSFVGGRVNTIMPFIAPGGVFIDADNTGESPGWANPTARNFRLKFSSVCIDQGSDGELWDDTTDVDIDGNIAESSPRDLYKPDLQSLPASISTREVNVPGAGTLPQGHPQGIGVDSGNVPGAICDIGAFEHRIVNISPG